VEEVAEAEDIVSMIGKSLMRKVESGCNLLHNIVTHSNTPIQ